MASNSSSNEFVAFVNDEGTASVIREWAERQGFSRQAVHLGGSDALMPAMDSGPPAKLVIVDLDDKAQPVQTAARLVSLCGPSARLIAIGLANDVGIYRSMLAAGLADYMVKPVSAEALSQARLAASRGSGSEALKATEPKIIAVIGTRGGVGASTLAVNLGWIAAHEMKSKCAVLDLDLQFGTCSLALDMEPGRGLRDIVSSPQRVDSLMVSSAMVSDGDNLSLLGAEEPVGEPIQMDPSAVAALVKELRMSNRVVIVDLPGHLLSTQKRILSSFNEIVLVTEMSLAGIRDTLRIKQVLKDAATSARVTIVASGTGPQRPAAVDEAAFAKSAQAKPDFTLQDDHKNANAASNAGKPLASIAPQAVITKTIRELAIRLFGENKSGAGTRKGLFGFLGGSDNNKSGAKK